MHVLKEHMDSFLLVVHLGMKLLNQKVSAYLAVVLLPAFQNGGTSPRRKKISVAPMVGVACLFHFNNFLWMIYELFPLMACMVPIN